MADEQPQKPAEPERKDGARSAVLAFGVWLLARIIGLTLRIRFEHFERVAEAQAPGRGAILVTWHGRTLICANVFRKLGYWALISLSRDGEVQNRIFQRFGFQTIRGSTGRGGVRAALQLAGKIKEGGTLAFTPDGPRGPTHKVQQGTIFLAQRAGCPIVPIGVSARPRKLLPTWDSYMIPMPFARAAFVVGEPIYLSADLDDEGKESAARAVEQALNDCEMQAEALMGYAAVCAAPPAAAV